MISSLRACAKILLIILWTIPLVITQRIVMIFTRGPNSYYVPQLWHKGIAFIIGLKTEVTGIPPTSEQTVFVSNHLSYLDIFAIGSSLRASFIAKEDIAHWPAIGYLCTVQQTAFISRSSDQAKKVANSLAEMLENGKSLILFPEGTSTDGRAILPFKSSLFSLVRDDKGKAIAVQPFTLSLIETDGRPLDDSTNASRDLYAWYGDMDFAPHFWKFLQTSGARVRLTFHSVIHPQPDQDRKVLAKMTWDTVNSALTPKT